MSNMNNYQVAVFLLGEQNSGKSWIANRFVKDFGFTQKISIENVLQKLASDTTVFNIPPKSFEPQSIDIPFVFPLQVKEMHIRRLLGRVGLMLPVTAGFTPNRVAISNFICPRLTSPRHVLEYIAFDILNKLSPEYLPIMAYQDFIGCAGIYVIDDLKTQAELATAKNCFQLVYTVYVDSKKKKKKEEGKIARCEIDWDTIQADYTICNEYDDKKMDDVLLNFVSKFNDDVSGKIKKGNIRELPNTTKQELQHWQQSKGPLAERAQAQKEFTTGKANFVKGNMDTMLTPNDRIRDYHVRGQY